MAALTSKTPCHLLPVGPVFLDVKPRKRDHIKHSRSRSRSFLHCISKRLGRHFAHGNHPREAIYSSHEDIRTSSTDSFSLSFEHASCAECHLATSSFDLTSDERTSRASSASACSRLSPALCALDVDNLDMYRLNQHHIYVDAVCRRPASSLGHHEELSSDDDDDIQTAEEEQQATTSNTASTTPRSSSLSKGLHLSRISISSSVCRLFQHLSISSSSNSNSNQKKDSGATSSAPTRSLSCSSTPLRCIRDTFIGKSKKSPAKGEAKPKKSFFAKKEKKAKKQQSILRPPIQYVYMKGMSGLYTRVPRYTVCYQNSMYQYSH